MQPNAAITPSTLSVKDLPWQILWQKDKCTLCGRCTAVCPVNAIELGVFRKRRIKVSLEPQGNPSSSFDVYHASARKPIRHTPVWGVPPATWSAPTTPSSRCVRTRPTSCGFTSTAADNPAAVAADAMFRGGSWTRSSSSAFPCSPTRPWTPAVTNSSCVPFGPDSATGRKSEVSE